MPTMDLIMPRSSRLFVNQDGHIVSLWPNEGLVIHAPPGNPDSPCFGVDLSQPSIYDAVKRMCPINATEALDKMPTTYPMPLKMEN